jgi:hypothetical protein
MIEAPKKIKNTVDLTEIDNDSIDNDSIDDDSDADYNSDEDEAHKQSDNDDPDSDDDVDYWVEYHKYNEYLRKRSLAKRKIGDVDRTDAPPKRTRTSIVDLTVETPIVVDLTVETPTPTPIQSVDLTDEKPDDSYENEDDPKQSDPKQSDDDDSDDDDSDPKQSESGGPPPDWQRRCYCERYGIDVCESPVCPANFRGLGVSN